MNSFHPLVPSIFPPEAVVAGFTTRRGGVSLPPFDSLNLGDRTADDPESVRENYRILYTALGVHGEQAALMRQVHDARIRVIEKGGMYADTDCLLTAEPGVLLGIRVADCVPVLLHNPRTGVVGAAHCGWRPIVTGILERTVETMRREWNFDPGDLYAALGPSAGACCYEVGPEVAERFAPSSIESRGGRLYADLRGEIMRRLRAAGVSGRRIESFPHCTICTESSYFSHRRDGDRSGRMMGYIMIKTIGTVKEDMKAILG
jgi:hypothetical protein